MKSEGSGREGTRWRGRWRSKGTGFVAGRMSGISVGNEFQEGGGIHTSSLTSRQGLMGYALCAVPSGGDDCMVHRRAQVHNVCIPTQHALPVHPRPRIPETASEFQLSEDLMFSLSLVLTTLLTSSSLMHGGSEAQQLVVTPPSSSTFMALSVPRDISHERCSLSLPPAPRDPDLMSVSPL